MRKATLFIGIILLSTLSCQMNLIQSLIDNPYIELRTLQTNSGVELDYFFIRPECNDPTETYPALLVLPAGEQTTELAQWTIDTYFLNASIQRNWVMICPIAPEGSSFYQGSEALIPELLDAVEQSYNIEEGRFHVAGVSAGGISAFRIAILYAERIKSVLAFPGYPPESDMDKLHRLEDIPVVMFAGERDYQEFLDNMQQTFDALVDLGFEVAYNVLLGESHVIQSLNGQYLFSILDDFRP